MQTAKWPVSLYYSDAYRSQLQKCGIRFIKSTYKWIHVEFPSEFMREKRDKNYFQYRGNDPQGKYMIISVQYESNGTLLSFNVIN